jgi:hypothetical protein
MTADVTVPVPLEDRYPVPAGKTGIMHQLCAKGDIPIMWNKDDADEVAVARRAFDDARKAGFIVYRAEGKDGSRGEVITRFDPKAERLIMVKQHKGG